VVGEIIKVKNHPNADKLKVVDTKISSGKTVEIVCGGINLKDGIKVTVALPGAKILWHGEGDLVELKKTKIRGVESFGMICASSEIGLDKQFPAKDEREIMDISFVDDRAGTAIKKALGLDDVVFQVENKSITHRPDLWNHYGMARELSILYKKPLKKLQLPKLLPGKNKKLKVKIKDTKICHRYMGVIIDGIQIQPSPEWMQKRLRTCGIRSINNLVDITNYVMLELGQPMHVFDADKINGDILVRKARSGEKILALDGIEYTLDNEDPIIADKNGPIAMAGIMGGEKSGVATNTKTVIFEAANFDPTTIRRSSIRHALRSEGSSRHEKSLDPTNIENALYRAVQLALELCPKAKISSNIADEKNFKLNQGPIQISHEFIEKKIGIEIKPETATSILKNLGFEMKGSSKKLSVTVPTWRATKDVSIAEDLVEEVARIYGYENIPALMPKTVLPRILMMKIF